MTPDASDLCVFAIKRGQIKNRYDVQNALYILLENDKAIHKIPLGDLVKEEPCYGTSATAVDRISEDQPKYIRITDFDDFGIEDNHTFMTAETYAEKHLLEDGDVLFARTGGTVGKTYYYDGSIGKAVFAGYCIRFRFDAKKVLPKFVYWCTKTASYAAWVKGIQRPSGQPNINKEEFKSFEIPLPSYTLQKEMTEKMDCAFFAFIDKNKESRLLLDIDDSLFLELGINKLEYKERLSGVVLLSDVLNDETFSAEYYHPERMAAIRMLQSNHKLKTKKLSDIVDFHRDIVVSAESDEKYLGLAGVESQTGELSGVEEEAAGQAFVYQAGDILYGRLRPYLNKVLLAEMGGICSTEFHVMRVYDKNEIIPEYLATVMRSPLILAQTKHMMTGNTHPRISNDDVKNLYIPIPDIDLQRKIVEELNNRRKEARKLKKEAEQEWADAKVQFEKKLLGEG